MPDLRVVEALDAPLLDAFVELPYRLYRGDPSFVPPLRAAVRRKLDPRRNPFTSHGLFAALLARIGDRPVGRVVAIDDRGYNQFHGTHHGFFALLEAEPDVAVVGALLDAAAAWCRGRGADVLLGPMGFVSGSDCGLTIEGFQDPPMIGLPHTAEAYPVLVEACGLRKAWDLLAYRLPMSEEAGGSLLHFAEAVRRTHRVALRAPERTRYQEEMERLLSAYHAAWSRSAGFSPLSRSESDALLSGLRPLLDPELIRLAEIGGQLVGFSICVPNINEALAVLPGRLLSPRLLPCLYRMRRISSLRLCAMGVLPELARSGISALLYLDTLAAARRRGYRQLELSPVVEGDELVTRGIEALGGVPSKRFRVYQRPIL